MKADSPQQTMDGLDGAELLQAVVYANETMDISTLRDGGALVKVPMRRPRWLAPPLSWILPFSSTRRVRLDAVGANVLKRCNGRDSVERIIETFAVDNKLSFREAQLSISVFLRQMTERGLVVIVGPGEDPAKP